MRFPAAIFRLILITLLFGASARAADITCTAHYEANSNIVKNSKEFFPSGRKPVPNQTCSAIKISGIIFSGDDDKFLEILRANHPFINSVFIFSPGGNVEASLKIGKLIRKYFLSTHAPETVALPEGVTDKYGNPIKPVGWLIDPSSLHPKGGTRYLCNGTSCECASACFLIWAAGAERWGSRIGVHRPSTTADEFTKLPPDKAVKAYRKALENIATYLKTMEIPQKYIDLMTSTASNDIYWLSEDEASKLKEPPSIDETFLASCGGITPAEQQELEIFSGEIVSDIFKKDMKAGTCRSIKLDQFRDSFDSIEDE